MKRYASIYIICLLYMVLVISSCHNNVYIPVEETITGLWYVDGLYFNSMQEAMDYIYESTRDLRAIEDVPAERTAILQRDVNNGERGGGLMVPEDFSGMLIFDFNGYTYEFDDSLEYFFEIRGGDEVYITNGTTVIYNEADHEPYAIAVNTDTVTIDSHLIDDRRVDPEDSTVSEAKLLQVGEKGSVVVENVEETDSSALTGQISVVTDGSSGGKLSINNARVVVTNIITAYKDSDGSVSDTIPEETEIEEEAKSIITINSGYVSIKNIEKLSDYYIKNNDNSVTLYKKAILNIFSNDSENQTEIDNPHDTEEVKIDSAINSIIENAGEGGENVEHDYIHSPVVEHPGQAATCTEDGFLTYWECSACGKKFKTSGCEPQNEIDNPIAIPALGHSYGTEWKYDDDYHWHVCDRDSSHTSDPEAHTFSEWTYDAESGTSSKHCTVCGYKIEEDHKHVLTHVERIAHTATTEGNIEYWYCAECGNKYSDSSGENLITDISDPHQIEHVAAVPHTCTEDGNIEYWSCSVCGLIFSDEEGTEVITDSVVDPASHDGLKHFNASSATCTEDGNIEYWYCPVCEKYFSDSSLATEISEADTVINKTGHSYSTSWTTSEEKHWHECEHDSSHKADEANHTWTTDDWVYNSTLEKYTKTCSVCGYVLYKDHTHSSTGWVTTDPTNHYKICEECGTQYDSANHSFSDWTYNSTTKKDERTCSVCGREEERTHVHGTEADETLSHVTATDATCTTAGNIEYWHCSTCNEYFTDSNATTKTTAAGIVIPALGHDWSTAWSKDSDYHWHVCSRCGEKKDYGQHQFTVLYSSSELNKLVAITGCETCDYSSSSSVVSSHTGAFALFESVNGLYAQKINPTQWEIGVTEEIKNKYASCKWYDQNDNQVIENTSTDFEPLTLTISVDSEIEWIRIYCRYYNTEGTQVSGGYVFIHK